MGIEEKLKITTHAKRNIAILTLILLSASALGFTQRVEFIQAALQFEILGISLLTIAGIFGIFTIYLIWEQKI